jgi:hypothetical protein
MKKQLLCATIASLIACSVYASDNKRINDSFNIATDSTIYLDVSVGEIDITTHDSDELTLEVVVSEQDHHFFSSVDIDDAELDKDVRVSDVHLRVEMDNTQQKWRLTVPKTAHLNINLGVGEIDIDHVSRNIDLELGVGEADIRLEDDNYASIELESGVGSADIKGFKNSRSHQAMVSEDASWHGDGKYTINAEVGVGDLDVRY